MEFRTFLIVKDEFESTAQQILTMFKEEGAFKYVRKHESVYFDSFSTDDMKEGFVKIIGHYYSGDTQEQEDAVVPCAWLDPHGFDEAKIREAARQAVKDRELAEANKRAQEAVRARQQEIQQLLALQAKYPDAAPKP